MCKNQIIVKNNLRERKVTNTHHVNHATDKLLEKVREGK